MLPMQKNTGPALSSQFIYVDRAEALSRLTAALRTVDRVAFDTEADSLHHYFEKVCLIQLSFAGATYVVDPLARLDLGEFLAELSRKELIIQGADYDLRMMKKTFGFRPAAPVFDMMLAAQVLGYEKIGLAALVEKFCGVVLPKSSRKADWARRPLLARHLTYAADDTRYLETVAARMTGELQSLGRLEWHRECCERVVEVSGRPDKAGEREEWRIKGSSKLPSGVLVYVKELWSWRDAESRRRDRPPFMVMSNENLIALAGWLAANPGASVAGGPAFLRKVSGGTLTRLEDAIRRARACPAEAFPEPLKMTFTREAPVSGEKVEELRAACKKIADELKIEACFLVSRAAAVDIVRCRPSTVEGVMEAGGLMRWQAERILPAVRAVLG
ncbi:MAG TPA: HRDC domain-containing protein [Candidatus Omnitrophota bacterium]|nr:HRDC domain-containing protein [Candidatus Omnitrophota bacterium]